MDPARTLSPPLDDDAEPIETGTVLLPLPPLIMRDIFASLVHEFTRAEMFVAPQVRLPRDLQPLACASKAWNALALARDVTAEMVLGVVQFGQP
jgi:hypothetical protein